jgi:hypothetical protein
VSPTTYNNSHLILKRREKKEKKRKEGKEEKREERYTRPGTAARGKCECELFRIEIPVPTTRRGYSEQSASETLMVNFCCFIVSNKMCIILFCV